MNIPIVLDHVKGKRVSFTTSKKTPDVKNFDFKKCFHHFYLILYKVFTCG